MQISMQPRALQRQKLRAFNAQQPTALNTEGQGIKHTEAHSIKHTAASQNKKHRNSELNIQKLTAIKKKLTTLNAQKLSSP